MSRSRMSSVRTLVAQHPACPVEVLERLLSDRIYPVQAAAANHPTTPRATRAMWQLAHNDSAHGH
jgi:hypothetical protein